MPKARTVRTRKAPEGFSLRLYAVTHSFAGFDVIEPTIIELEKKMRDAENEPHEGYDKFT